MLVHGSKPASLFRRLRRWLTKRVIQEVPGDEPWKAVTLDHTNLVEVVIASVSFGGFRMQREGPLQTKCFRRWIEDLRLAQRAPAILRIGAQQTDHLFSVERFWKGSKVFFHPDRVAYQKALAAAQWCNGQVLRNPIRTRKRPPHCVRRR